MAYTEAFEKFKIFKEDLFEKHKTENLSESDTRSKILDYIFNENQKQTVVISIIYLVHLLLNLLLRLRNNL